MPTASIGGTPRFDTSTPNSRSHRVKVRDPKGKVHEIFHLNAMDLVNHNGWTLVTDETDQDRYAKIPKRRKSKEAKTADEIAKTDVKKRPMAKRNAEDLAKRQGPMRVPETIVQPDMDKMDTVDDPSLGPDEEEELAELEAEDAGGKSLADPVSEEDEE